MTTTRHGFGITLRDVTFEDAVRRVTHALENEGFGVRLRRVVGVLASRDSV